MFDWIGDLFEAGADLVGDVVGGIFGGGGGGAAQVATSAATGGGGFFDLAGGILGGNGGSFWNSPITGHILGAVGSELLREDPYDLAYDTALGRERGRRDAMDFGFTHGLSTEPVISAPQSTGTGLAPGYGREGGTKPASADWWQETDEERRRKKQEWMTGHA